jgi:hypothetical protein
MANTAGDTPGVATMKHCIYASAIALLNLLITGGIVLLADEGDSTLVQPIDTPGRTIFSANFEHAELGIYTEAQLNRDWNSPAWSDGIEEHRVAIVQIEPDTTALAVNFPAHTYGSEKNGAVWRLEFDSSYSAVEVRFDVMFEKDFDFVRGGKLPGLFGGKGNTGGNKPNGKDGFSARMMWREDGRVVQYLYYPDQPTRYGHQIPWIDQATKQPIRFIPGQWHTVVHRVCMNTPGKRDGTLQAFFDNQPVLKMDSIRFRDTDAFAIDGFLLSTFFGGGDASWETTAQETIYFDNFQIIKIACE